MDLITLAHLGEAQSIIENFELTKISPDCYQGSELILLITGEGPFEAAIKTSRILAKHPCRRVINLGVCGSLDPEFAIGSFHPVRSIYLVVDGKPQFKSYSTGQKGLDLITSFERVLSTYKAQELSGVAKLVDREVWGVAMAAKDHGLPLLAYKLVSDKAGSTEACELVREKAKEFSDRLALELNQILHEPNQNSELLEHELGSEFHFTFTSSKLFQNLLRKLTLRENKSRDELLADLGLSEIRTLKVTPKERSKLLLEKMQARLDPFKGLLQKKLMAWKKPFLDQGIDIQNDQSFESPRLKFSLEAQDEKELASKIHVLQRVSFQTFHELRQGKVDVE